MKTTPRRMFALLLALVLLLSLCACTQKTQTEPDEPKINTAHKKTPESQQEEAVLQSNGNDFVSQDKTVDTPPVQYAFSQEAETSLGWLRDRIDFPTTMFGAAYLGYVGGLFDVLIGVFFTAAFIMFRRALVSFFLEEDQLIVQAASFLWVIGLSAPMLGITNIVTSYFQVLGKAFNSMIITML